MPGMGSNHGQMNSAGQMMSSGINSGSYNNVGGQMGGSVGSNMGGGSMGGPIGGGNMGGPIGGGNMGGPIGGNMSGNIGGGMSGNMGSNVGGEDYENEPPLLEELGVNIPHIVEKTKAVLHPMKSVDPNLMDDTDMAGPLVFCLLLGATLLLRGKVSEPRKGAKAVLCHDDAPGTSASASASAISTSRPRLDSTRLDSTHPLFFSFFSPVIIYFTSNETKVHFGYIYGFGVFGCLSVACVIQLMAVSKDVRTWLVFSILGYNLLPINFLAVVAVLINLKSYFGFLLSAVAIGWSTAASTRIFVSSCGLEEQKYLISYPIFLLYSVFTILTVF